MIGGFQDSYDASDYAVGAILEQEKVAPIICIRFTNVQRSRIKHLFIE